jgi:hypothetical protein
VELGCGEDVRVGGDARNEWDLRFNDHVPFDLNVQLGAGESDLDSLTLTALDRSMGAEETTVDLTGDYERDRAASIEGGVGEATVRLPGEVGVSWMTKGVSVKSTPKAFQRDGEAYLNDAYGASDVTLDVDIPGGVGQIDLEVV